MTTLNEPSAVPSRKTAKDFGEGVFRTSPEGAYLFVNPELAAIYGYESP